GLSFTAIYFFVFRFLILKFNIATPGREKDDQQETKLYSKQEYRERKNKDETASAAETADDTAFLYIEALGGKDNITEVTNCATRLRVSVKDETKVEPDSVFRALGSHGVVRNGKAFQVIIGLSVPQMRERVEKILNQ
ncbi:PTS maltose transporter subunit IIBC, partial [Bacillus spizizenii]|nr:PTS maltose transporter subunit IIBC [Bacillus spizizenii]